MSGLALTMLGTGIAETLGRNWEGKVLSSPIKPFSEDFLSLFPPGVRTLFRDSNLLVVGSIILALVLWFFLFKTKAGLSFAVLWGKPCRL